MVDIAKFFRSAKNAIGNVKDTLEEEMNVSDIKKEALAYKAQLEDVKSSVDVKSQLGNLHDSILSDDEITTPQNSSPKEQEEVTFKKKKKKDSYAEVENV
jgi:sec-independent protein translocase protein TatB